MFQNIIPEYIIDGYLIIERYCGDKISPFRLISEFFSNVLINQLCYYSSKISSGGLLCEIFRF